MLEQRFQQKPLSSIEQYTVTDGEDAVIGATSQKVYIDLGDSYQEQYVTRRELLLATHALRNIERPFFSSEFEGAYDLGLFDNELSTSAVHDWLSESLPVPLSSHFVRFGRGRGTQYVFLHDNHDVSAVCERGRTEIRESSLSAHEKRRRLAAYDALEAAYNNDNEFMPSKHKLKKTIAASAFLVVAGGAGTYYHYHRSSDQ
jgi:hypothetical protein